MIHTTRGEMPLCLLRKEVVRSDYPDAEIIDTRLYIGAELVRNDIVANLKGKDLGFAQQDFS